MEKRNKKDLKNVGPLLLPETEKMRNFYLNIGNLLSLEIFIKCEKMRFYHQTKNKIKKYKFANFPSKEI